MVSMLAQKTGDAGPIPVGHPKVFSSLDTMAVICYLAYIGERKRLCHSFSKVVDLLLAMCMLVQEVTDMVFNFGLTFGSPCTERSLVLGPLVLLIRRSGE